MTPDPSVKGNTVDQEDKSTTEAPSGNDTGSTASVTSSNTGDTGTGGTPADTSGGLAGSGDAEASGNDEDITRVSSPSRGRGNGRNNRGRK